MPTEAEIRDLERRKREDFDFMVLCASKGNMAMYQLLRDKSLDTANDPKQLEPPTDDK